MAGTSIFLGSLEVASFSTGGLLLLTLTLAALMGLLFYAAITHTSSKLQGRRNQYKRIFEENPNPMWVYDLENLRILAVNDAAIQTYGYSREEFLQLTILELRPEREAEKLLENLRSETPVYARSGTWLHKKKGGQEFFVSIYSHRTQFNKRSARLVLALDINDRLQAEQRVLEQNEKLREIAHLQSHNVRRPVASIMGLIGLFDKKDLTNEINGVVIEKLDVVCKELDLTIHKIVEKTYELEVDTAADEIS
jgi:PAS domain S-box-containing protein